MQLGVGGILVVLVLRIVFDFLKDKKRTGTSTFKEITCSDLIVKEVQETLILSKAIIKKLDKMEQTEDKLFDMHNKCDEDGLPLWYMPRSMKDILVKMEDTLQELTNVIRTNTAILVRLEKN